MDTSGCLILLFNSLCEHFFALVSSASRQYMYRPTCLHWWICVTAPMVTTTVVRGIVTYWCKLSETFHPWLLWDYFLSVKRNNTSYVQWSQRSNWSHNLAAQLSWSTITLPVAVFRQYENDLLQNSHRQETPLFTKSRSVNLRMTKFSTFLVTMKCPN